MSTEIKPGQIWAWQDTYDARGPHGTTFEVVDASPDAPDVAYQYRDSAGMDPELVRAAPADVIRANANLVRCVCRTGTEDTCNQHSATPAPLDPSKVKAGDTVTLESGTALVRDVVIEAKSRGVGQFVFYTAENPDPLIPGTYYLVNSGAWTLTDHQPAPEPEPEWKPGTLALITIRGQDGEAPEHERAVRRPLMGAPRLAWHAVDTGGFWYDENVTDVRPLVVIDPAGVEPALRESAAFTSRVWQGELSNIIIALREALGIEASS